MLTTALLLGAAAPAEAQSFLGLGAPQVLSLPEAGTPETRPDRRPRPAAPDRIPVPAAATPHRPFQALTTPLRLAGEENGLQWPVYLTEGQARERLRLRIGYLAAISVVPEASFLTATINGVAIGRSEIKAPGAIRIIEFDIPTDLLKPGYNAVAIAGVQRHRVDCSLDATYELWTQIDPAWTGLVAPPGGATAGSLRDLPAVAPDSRGIVPVRIVLKGRPAFATFERLIGLVQRVALAGGFSQVSVEFAPEPGGPAGLDIVVGRPDGGLGTQPLTFQPAQGNRAARIVVPGDQPADIAAAQQIVVGSASRDPEGSPKGLQALALSRGLPLQSRESLRFSDLGLQSQEFSGRLFRSGFEVTLPTDFVPADYDKAVLELSGGYAAGLEVGAQIVVDVNGRNVASVPLARAEGDAFRGEAVALPLSRWRPGRNRVDIRAFLPTGSDRVCEDGTARQRFLLLDRSILVAPRLARALRAPDLAATFSGGLPQAAPGSRPRLVVPTPDRESMAAAATIVVQMALSAGRPIDFELANDRILERRTPTLVVAPARALEPEVLRTVGLNPDQIRQIWQGRAAAPPLGEPSHRPVVMDGASIDRLRNNLPPACALPATGPRPAILAPPRVRTGAAEAEERDFPTGWNGGRRPQSAFADQAGAALARLVGAARSGISAVSAWAGDQVREPEIDVGAQASLIVGQGLAGSDAGSLLTVVTAPNAANLQASVTCLTTPSIWNRVEGRVVALDGNDGTLTIHEAKRVRFLGSDRMSFENMRLVVAGWFSINPSVYALLVFAAAIGLGLSTSAMLRDVGRHNPNARRSGRDAGKEDSL